MSDPKRELLAGDFQCDLVAEDENGDRVIVENQLEATNHDHLGKVITYLTNLDAKAAIWVSTAPRPEHIRAIQWLNEITPDNISFYLVRLAAYRIAGHDTYTAVHSNRRPQRGGEELGEREERIGGAHILRLRFWEQLLERAKQRGVMFHAQRSPTKDAYISAGAGVESGISFNYVVWMTDETAWNSTLTPKKRMKTNAFLTFFYGRSRTSRNRLGRHSLGSVWTTSEPVEFGA